MTNQTANSQVNRSYLSKDFSVTSWESVEPLASELLEREISSVDELKKWFADLSELEAAVEEDSRWRYIKITIDTKDEEAKQAYVDYVSNIAPKLNVVGHKLNQKMISSPFLKDLDNDKFNIYLKRIKQSVDLFSEANVPLVQKESLKSNEFGEISGRMSIEVDGEEMTLQQASILLKRQDRDFRKSIFDKVSEARLNERNNLDKVLSELVEIRNEMGVNANFENYRDYKFAKMCRFDYTPKDCFSFHDAVEAKVVPLMAKLSANKRENLGYDKLYPYDLEVDETGKPPLKPVSSSKELVAKTIECFNKIDPYFGECISTMEKLNYLDLDSRMGKAPGGYNMTMPEVGIPFIFMNSANSSDDIRVMTHEGGHAVHTFLAHPLEINGFKEYPSEVAELASMSMELFAMDNWDDFYDNEEDLKRAKKKHIEGILKTFPGVSLIDSFQHWLYENPNHTAEERSKKWLELSTRFDDQTVCMDGYEELKANRWQRVLHIFEVPFYFIEYAFAQLGAIAMWKNYRENPAKTIEQYKAALSLGYTKSISEIYETAGIRFDFSKEYVDEIISFLVDEYNKL